MKYKDRDELVTGLRDLADFIERKGLELPIDHPSMTLNEWLFDDNNWNHKRHSRTAREKIGVVARKLGKAEKDWGSGSLDLRRRFGPVSIEFTIGREKVCERRVVGSKTVPERVVPAHVQEEVEWICTDPILAN